MRCILVLLLCCFFLFCFILGFGQYESTGSALFSAQQYLHFVHRLLIIITVLCYHICIYLSTVIIFLRFLKKAWLRFLKRKLGKEITSWVCARQVCFINSLVFCGSTKALPYRRSGLFTDSNIAFRRLLDKARHYR